MKDLYNFLIIITRLSADQKSLSDSMLKSAAMIDVVLTETVSEIMQSHTANTQAIAEITDSVNQLDSRTCKENHETGELQTQVSSIRNDLRATDKKLNSIIETLLEIKEMIHKGPRPMGPATFPPAKKTLNPQGKTHTATLTPSPNPPAPEHKNPLPEESDGREFSSGMPDIVHKGYEAIYGELYGAAILAHNREGATHPGTIEEFAAWKEGEWDQRNQEEDEIMDDTASC